MVWNRIAAALGLASMPAIAADKTPWPDLPKIGFMTGRPATIEDAKQRSAIFSMDGGSKGAVPITIPQYAIWTDEHGAKHPMILVQAERAPDGMVMAGLRGFDGSEAVVTMPEVTLLGTKKPR